MLGDLLRVKQQLSDKAGIGLMPMGTPHTHWQDGNWTETKGGEGAGQMGI